MKAFLSHASKDKGFVNQVAEIVGGANTHLDADTFEYGVLNTQAILNALETSELFVLFVSSQSNDSPIVRFESRVAEELLARGVIDRLLFICLNPKAFDDADSRWKNYNFVRRESSPRSAARLIQSTLMGVRARKGSAEQPFVGRGEDLEAAKERLIDPEKPAPSAISVSGNTGIGRRTFARRLFKDVFPNVNNIVPEIAVDSYDSYDELYRKIRAQIEPETTVTQLIETLTAFSLMTEPEKAAQICQLLTRMAQGREALMFRDHGGLLQESGAFQPALQAIIEKADSYPHPAIILIADRTSPQSERARNPTVVYCPLTSLSEGAVRQMIALRLRQKKISYTEEDLVSLISLSDCHPFNVNYIMECVDAYTLPVFLANPADLTTWKHKRTADFIESLPTSPNEDRVLSILKHFPALDFSVIVEASGLSTDKVGNAVATLIDKHVVETGAGTYFVSPPLKSAIDRSPRFNMASADLQSALKAIGGMLVAAGDDSVVPVSMIESSILAMLQADLALPDHVSAFLLPSHLIWLARRRYDERHFKDCIRLGKEALKSQDRLSLPGKVEACRLVSLSAARLDQSDDFDFGLGILKALPRDEWVRSMIEFLKGFNARLNGRLPEAENFQREALKQRPGNFHAGRELAFICLTRGNLTDAEVFARQAYEKAQDNPFILDILLGVLIRLSRSSHANNVLEIEDLLDRLGRSASDDGRSFYETRRAEHELISGDVAEAARLIDLAASKTPGLFNVRALRARIYLARTNRAVVADEIERMNRLVQRSSNEGRTNLRPLLEIRAEYSLMCKDFAGARAVYDVPGVFDDSEVTKALKGIEMAEAYFKQHT